MIGYIKGKVLAMQANNCVLIENNGIGYEVICSGAAMASFVGGEAEVFTYLQVKEDGVALFGFVSPEEKNLFTDLISVSGIGARTGVAILSTLRPEALLKAIAIADVKTLSTVKGLGKKGAERIVLELKDKVSLAGISPELASATEIASGGEEDEAVSSLMGLGFSRSECLRAVAKAKAEGASGVEQIILFALKSM